MMKEKLKILYAFIAQKIPILGQMMDRIRYRKPSNSIKKRIHGKNNKITYKGSVLRSVIIDIVGDGNTIEIKNSCFLETVIFNIHGNNHSIIIGENCSFRGGGKIWFVKSRVPVNIHSVHFHIAGNHSSIKIGDNCRINGGGEIMLVDPRCSLVIGDGSTFENTNFAITEPGSRVVIGQDCMFGYDIDVRTGDSHSILDAKTMERTNYGRNVSVGNHVWVAAHCSILKGVQIPDESIVGVGSIVNKSFSQKGILIAGNPGRVVKEGITWSRERIYKDGVQKIVSDK
jgi:acetyltransferase-like isoleucine patch superfamily enzyme